MKKEVAHWKKTELDFQRMQQRLERILDSLDNLVMAVNESIEICLCNPACRQSIHTHSGGKGSGLMQNFAMAIIQEIIQNRERILLLEQAIAADARPFHHEPILDGLKQIKETLAIMEEGRGYLLPRHYPEKCRNAIHAMTLGLAYWQEDTGLTKVALAEQSGIWKVYMDKNGFQRTQTLDKYLDANKFPKKPRWNQIFGTIDFVLQSCKTRSPLRQKLKALQTFLKQCD